MPSKSCLVVFEKIKGVVKLCDCTLENDSPPEVRRFGPFLFVTMKDDDLNLVTEADLKLHHDLLVKRAKAICQQQDGSLCFQEQGNGNGEER